MTSHAIPLRVFVVGCSRSGTTVLQRLLAERFRLVTLPETDFFGIAGGGSLLRQWITRQGLAGERSVKALRRFQRMLLLYEIDVQTTGAFHFRCVAERFTGALDSLAQKRRASGWIEKTPKHFRYIDLIESYVPEAYFVHIVRSGPEVVASIVERARRNPGRFAGQENPHYAIKLWNRAIRTALRQLNKPRHAVIQYEQLCDFPIRSLDRVGNMIKINPLAEAMLQLLEKTELYRSHENWKAEVMQPIERRDSKFEQVFTVEERQAISECVSFPLTHSALCVSLTLTQRVLRKLDLPGFARLCQGLEMGKD